jgi:hypothetical protein
MLQNTRFARRYAQIKPRGGGGATGTRRTRPRHFGNQCTARLNCNGQSCMSKGGVVPIKKEPAELGLPWPGSNQLPAEQRYGKVDGRRPGQGPPNQKKSSIINAGTEEYYIVELRVEVY